MFNPFCSSVQGLTVHRARVDPRGWLALRLSASRAIGMEDDQAGLTLLIRHLTDDQPVWKDATLKQLVGCRITRQITFGPGPEILLTFDTGLLVASIALTAGETSWLLIDHGEHRLALIEPPPSAPPETVQNNVDLRITKGVRISADSQEAPDNDTICRPVTI